MQPLEMTLGKTTFGDDPKVVTAVHIKFADGGEVVTTPDSAETAREMAIDWQTWQQEVSLSYGELAEWQNYFEDLAKQFDLTEEFKEEAII